MKVPPKVRYISNIFIGNNNNMNINNESNLDFLKFG